MLWKDGILTFLMFYAYSRLEPWAQRITDYQLNIKQCIYTQLQKKPISHFSCHLWKSELRNENIFIPYSVAFSSTSFYWIILQFYLNLFMLFVIV